MEIDLLSIPTDIISIILLRLPVKSLLQLKSVCKYLYSFISSPYFIKIHLEQAINTHLNKNNYNPLLLILDWRRTPHRKHYQLSLGAEEYFDHSVPYSFDHTSVPYSLKFSSDAVGHHDDLLRHAVVNKINWPFESPLQFQIWGSCHGLLCIRGISTTDKRQNSLPFIWNPSTQELKTLPRTSMEINPRGVRVYQSYDYYGFGYDSKTDDYKVIRCTNRIDGNKFNKKRLDYTTIIKVYTLGTNSWRRVQLDNPFDLHYEIKVKKGMLVNGALHWLVSRPTSGLWSAKIVTFDIADEEFGEVERPYFVESFNFVDLQVVRECLCVLDMRLIEGVKNGVDVWVMNDYGAKDSWTKLFTIAVPSITTYPFLFDRPFKLLRFCKNGEVLMLRGGRVLIAYDPRKDTARCDPRHSELDIEGFLSTETYIESLVSLKPAPACQEQAQEEKMKQRKRKNSKKRKMM